MTTLEKLAAEQETAPKWKIAARASREWTLRFFAGTEQVDECRHVTSPVRCLEIVGMELAAGKSQGLTRIEVSLDGQVVH